MKYELFRYCVIGFSSTLLDLTLYALMTQVLGIHYQFANVISVAVSLLNGFLWNYYKNFNVKGVFLLRLASFYIVGMMGWLLSAVLLFVLVERLGLEALPSKGVSIVVCTVFQFCLNKAITFRRFMK